MCVCVVTLPFPCAVQTRSSSPFFIDLDEGAVTPMTIIATTEITDCVAVCGERGSSAPGSDAQPDKCIAVAGVVGDSDLTVMTYCIPSMPGAGVRRGSTWSVPGTIDIMNSVVDTQFIDLERGEGVVLLRDVDRSDVPDAADGTANFFRSRIDVLWKGDSFLTSFLPPLVDEETYLRAIPPAYNEQVQVRQISGIAVQPGASASAGVILHAEVVVSVIRNAPVLDDFSDGTQVTNN